MGIHPQQLLSITLTPEKCYRLMREYYIEFAGQWEQDAFPAGGREDFIASLLPGFTRGEIERGIDCIRSLPERSGREAMESLARDVLSGCLSWSKDLPLYEGLSLEEHALYLSAAAAGPSGSDPAAGTAGRGFRPDRSGGKWGFADDAGRWKMEPCIDALRPFRKNRAFASSDGKWGIVSIRGNWVLPPVLEEVPLIDSDEEGPQKDEFDRFGCCPAKQDGLWGFIDRSGKWIIRPAFDAVCYLACDLPQYGFFDRNGIAMVAFDGKYGFIDRTGRWVAGPVFDKPERLDVEGTYFDAEGYALVKADGSFGFIGIDGEWKIGPRFADLEPFDERGYARAITADGKAGYLGRTGVWLIPPGYDELEAFGRGDYAGFRLQERWGILDREGNRKFNAVLDRITRIDRYDRALVRYRGHDGCLDIVTGRWLLEPVYDSLTDFRSPSARWPQFRAVFNGNSGVIDLKGKWLIPPDFEELNPYFDRFGHCLAGVAGKRGLIDRRGNWVIKPLFEKIYPFLTSNLLMAVHGKRWGLLNRWDGEWVIEPEFREIQAEQIRLNGTLTDVLFVDKSGKWGVMDPEGTWILPARYEALKRFGPDRVWARQHGSWGIAGYDGLWLLKPEFEDIAQHHGWPLAKVKKNGAWGYIDADTGTWRVQPVFDELGGFSANGWAWATLEGKRGWVNRTGEWRTG